MSQGLLEWSNSIRLNMANDPGRQFFQEQVQSHGFLFLDDYLDNILYGAKQGALIDLVKTPGRKKMAEKKAKTTSKLANVMTFEDDSSKENSAPANKLHGALLKAKEDTHATHYPVIGSDVFSGIIRQEHEQTVLQPAARQDAPSSFVPSNPVVFDAPQVKIATPASPEQNELSVIAEADENIECSRTSIHPTADKSQAKVEKELAQSTVPTEEIPHREPSQEMNISSSSIATFHSITLESPNERAPVLHAYQQAIPITEQNDTPALSPVKDSDDIEIRLNTHSGSSSEHDNAINSDILDAVRNDPIEVSTEDALAKQNVEQPSTKLFPLLPEPLPPRKSTRSLRDPSVGSVAPGISTPGTTAANKRTSWLMKVREAKALEGVVRRPVASTSRPSVSGQLKRKSDVVEAATEPTGSEDQGRPWKALKSKENDTASQKVQNLDIDKEDGPYQEAGEQSLVNVLHIINQPPAAQEGVLDRLRKTVEGLGAKAGKGMDKSIGGAAAVHALAEARAAAEAKVAERNNKDEEVTMAVSTFAPREIHKNDDSISEQGTGKLASVDQQERRLSVSDLFPSTGRPKERHSPTQKANFVTSQANTSRVRVSTTPANSPHATQSNDFVLPSGPVFNKPPPVFVPPVIANRPLTQVRKSNFSFNLPTPILFTTTTASTSRHHPSPVLSKPETSVALTAHSTLESVRSDAVFDVDDVPAWMPGTQDTDHSQRSEIEKIVVLDEDDSWPLDEKLAEGVQWTFGGAMSKEDSMTWSTLPSQSQRADTGTSKYQSTPERDIAEEIGPRTEVNPDVEGDESILDHDAELEDIIFGGKSADINAAKSQSQTSLISSVSSQSQVGFLGQASKLLSSALGTSKKGKPEVKKVLQMAAVAAKKQQEESDKKALRLKEMENRRQLAMQRKAEEEKARTQDQERKIKEEGERRKREREENTDKRPLKVTGSKKEEDTTKKRKLESEKKIETKKLHPTPGFKPSKIAIKQMNSTTNYSGSLQNIPASTSEKVAESSKSVKIVPAQSQKGKAKAAIKPSNMEDDISQPSQIVQTQMAARAKAQLQAANRTEPLIPTESIELPDINSEYSDSEDEDRPRTFDPPGWAQSPELRQALEMQSTINPDDIFGAIRPLKMEELFKTRTSRFRARTSSANWTGVDRLTLEEERDYAKRMGFR